MSKVIWCDPGWFQGLFYYGFCPDEKAWNKELKRLSCLKQFPTAAGNCSFFEDEDGARCVIVTVKQELENSHSPLEVACLIVHEAVHVWQELCDVIGEESPSAEFEAYSIQRISQELIKAFEQTRRPLDKCDKVIE